jgi:hypothetical protein
MPDFWATGYGHEFAKDIHKIASNLGDLVDEAKRLARCAELNAAPQRPSADPLPEAYEMYRDHAKVDSEPWTVLLGFDADTLESMERTCQRFLGALEDARRAARQA